MQQIYNSIHFLREYYVFGPRGPIWPKTEHKREENCGSSPYSADFRSENYGKLYRVRSK